MATRKTILHIIQNFGIGGAETAVVGVLKNLKEYNNIVVTLDGLNQFGDELQYDKYYNLNLRAYYYFPLAIPKLRKIIKENNVDLVHSQLYWSTVIARLATPKNIPLVTSIQSSVTNSVEYRKKWIGWLDRYTYNKRPSTILGVSRSTLDDYFQFLKLKPHKTGVLYNFVDTSVFADPAFKPLQEGETLRLITVGNLKPQKNQQYLLSAMNLLKGQPVSLDIYGEGDLRKDFEEFINQQQIPVRLMGKVRNLATVLKDYHLFVMSSHYEGFSLAVLEGMALQKPMLLSLIPTFTEQCAETARYFSLEDERSFIDALASLRNNPGLLAQMAGSGRERVLQYFTLNHHLASLKAIYAGELKSR